MSNKTRLKLSAKETDSFYVYLQDVVKDADPPSALQRIVMLCARRLTAKLHAKSMADESINTLLNEEDALALLYIIIHFPVPTNWIYTANVIRTVQEQLPNIEAAFFNLENP
jgi:hypothetical protein